MKNIKSILLGLLFVLACGYTVPGIDSRTQGKFTVTDSLHVLKTTEFSGNVNQSTGKFTMLGDSARFLGPVRFSSAVTLDVGSFSSSADITTTGFIVGEDSLRIGTTSQSSPAVISGNLTVWGKAVIDDSLRVTGPSRFASAVTYDVPPTFSDLITTGKGVIEDSLRVGISNQVAPAIISGNLTVYGTTTLNGATNFGNGGTVIADSMRANLGIFIGNVRITKVIRGIFTHDFASVSSASTLDETQAVTEIGLDSGSNWAVYLTPLSDMTAGLAIAYTRVSADNTLKIRLINTCGVAADNPSMSFSYVAVK